MERPGVSQAEPRNRRPRPVPPRRVPKAFFFRRRRVDATALVSPVAEY